MKPLAILLILIATSASMYGQEMQNTPVSYRVVAVSNAPTNVTSTSNVIRLYLPMSIYVPSAFSPNDDGLNDSFGAVGEGIEKYNLIIYNRWGQEVFHSSSIDKKWDGRINGKKVPAGEYSYQLLAYGKECGEVFKSGSVLIVN
ncbi:MAG: gliding motility-associated C-terminal domain-containing protein [Cyclobacteriaceae bacterium]|nr:gliding motility-associated C-terminal domain-containing protein [Cyclobacteriaceae bacterium]